MDTSETSLFTFRSIFLEYDFRLLFTIIDLTHIWLIVTLVPNYGPAEGMLITVNITVTVQVQVYCDQ